MEDIENNNDPIELQLIKNKAYKEATILGIKKTENSYLWKDFLKEEQKTFGGSKIFYIATSEAIKRREVDISELALFESLGTCFGRKPGKFGYELVETKGVPKRHL